MGLVLRGIMIDGGKWVGYGLLVFLLLLLLLLQVLVVLMPLVLS